MADAARKEKLVAAKKKLKKFQKAGHTNSPAPSGKPTNNNDVEKTKDNTPEPKQIPPVNGNASLENPTSTFIKPQFTSTPNKQNYIDTNAHSLQNSGPILNHSSHYPQQASENGSQFSAERLTSESTEKIQQISRQLNGLLSETSALVNNADASSSRSIEESEARNRELASALQRHLQANEQLSKQLNEIRTTNTKLQVSFETEKKGFEDKLKRELGALKEQLQVHIQTIGILVAEKTELQSSLNQNQKLAESRIEEIEELSGRLKASRQRVGDLERSFTGASSGKTKHEKLSKELGKEVDRLKLDLYKLNKSNEELQQQNSELQGKLQKKSSECAKTEDNLIELKGKLEMSELNLQQLQNSGSPIQDPQTTLQIDSLLAEKAQLLSRIETYEDQFRQVSQERDQISTQYQEYIQQLQQQSQTLQIQINSLVEEKEQVTAKNRELDVIINELKSNHDTVEASASEASKARQELAQKVEKMVMEVGELKHKYETQVADNSQLSRLIVEKEEHIMSLELKLSQSSDNEVDKEKLLESMQNDKTALSRAMAQNKELKSQLAELQNGFVKMSTDNMEMLNKMQSEQHVSKELGARLGQQEEELKEVREQLVQKEQLLKEMQKYAERLQEQSSHHSSDLEQQLTDFQKQTPLIETLQKELSSAQDTINALTNQNGELRSQVLQVGSRDSNANTSLEQVDSMTASIQQLEMERNQIVNILQEEKQLRQKAETQLDQLQQELATTTPATLNGDVINKAQFEALQHAMKQLEGKYTKAMRDKADLSDRAEQFEHIIMQLQGETDTIAEYITLYQTQRMLLRQRTEEKDEYISRLARDREDQAEKLNQLQSLLMQLLQDRQTGYHNNTEASLATPNHVPHPGHAMRQHKEIAGKLDSSHLEDWPDYSTDSSDASEVEHIVGGTGEDSPLQHSTPLRPPHKTMDHSTSDYPPTVANDPTAQKIMNLLSEIGSSVYNMDTSDYLNRSFLHCSHCSGQVITV